MVNRSGGRDNTTRRGGNDIAFHAVLSYKRVEQAISISSPNPPSRRQWCENGKEQRPVIRSSGLISTSPAALLRCAHWRRLSDSRRPQSAVRQINLRCVWIILQRRYIYLLAIKRRSRNDRVVTSWQLCIIRQQQTPRNSRTATHRLQRCRELGSSSRHFSSSASQWHHSPISPLHQVRVYFKDFFDSTTLPSLPLPSRPLPSLPFLRLPSPLFPSHPLRSRPP